jgi:restriction system protein
VARQSSKRETRAARRREEAAIKLLILGGAFVLGPLFVRNSILSKTFAALIPIGLLMLAAGGVLLWFGRRQDSITAPQRADPFGLRAAARADPHLDLDQPPVDRTVTELERMAAETSPRRPTTWSPAAFDVIEWRRFEALVELLFQQAGTELTTALMYGSTRAASQGRQSASFSASIGVASALAWTRFVSCGA